MFGHRHREEAIGIPIAGVDIPRELTRLHGILAGSTGTGKSTVIRSALAWLAEHGAVVVVVDPEREFIQQFYRPERGDVVLNPLDARCPRWTPWVEIAEPGDAEALAKSLLPDLPRGGGNELYFRQSARQLLVSVLQRLGSRNPHDIPKLLSGPVATLTHLVAGTSAASLIDPSAPPQRQAIISTLQLAVEGFGLLPLTAERTWSAREWVHERQGWVFLTFQEKQSDALLPLLSMWLDMLIRCLMDTDLERAQQEQVWVIIDELAALQRQPHLEVLLTRGRKRGVPTLVGFQAMTQLQERYGHAATATLLAAPATKLILRTGEPETALWCSQAIGEREVIRAHVSATSGSAYSRDGFNTSPQRYREPLVLPSELQQLPPFTGYLCIAGQNVAQVKIPPHPFEKRHPDFLPRMTPTPAPASAPSAPAPPPPNPVDGHPSPAHTAAQGSSVDVPRPRELECLPKEQERPRGERRI
jgi:type IV secretory pathway TraG/TraD family ATPase VirD4